VTKTLLIISLKVGKAGEFGRLGPEVKMLLSKKWRIEGEVWPPKSRGKKKRSDSGVATSVLNCGAGGKK